MTVDAARGEDPALAGDHVGAGTEPQRRVHAVHDIRVAGLPQRHDASVADTDIGFDHTPVVEHHHVGDHEIRRPGGVVDGALQH